MAVHKMGPEPTIVINGGEKNPRNGLKKWVTGVNSPRNKWTYSLFLFLDPSCRGLHDDQIPRHVAGGVA